MPYTTKNEYGQFFVHQMKREGSGNPVWVEWSYSTFSNLYSAHGRVNYSRTGGNASTRLSSCKRPGVPDGPWEWKLVTINAGPKLPEKVFSKRLQKQVWKRQPIQVWRLRKTWLKKSKRKRHSYIDSPPNPLVYQSVNVAYFGKNVTIRSLDNTSFGGGYIKEWFAEGDLWTMSSGWGFSGLGLFKQSYTLKGGFTTRIDPIVSEANNRAIGKLYERVKNQSVNLAQAFAERAQTAKMFLDIFRKLVTVVLAMKKGNLYKAAKTLLPSNSKEIANEILMIQYGIRPLLSDLDGIAKHLAEGPESIEFDVRVKSKVELPRAVLATNTYAQGPVRFTDTVTTHGYVEVVYKVRLRVQGLGLQREILTRLGFGNLASLAWELTPFSFVADWFIPIGNYLNNMDAFSGLDVVYTTKTVTRKEYIEFVRTFGGQSGNFNCSSGTVGFVTEMFDCQRSLIANLPQPTTPNLKDPISKDHIVNAMALARQLKR